MGAVVVMRHIDGAALRDLKAIIYLSSHPVIRERRVQLLKNDLAQWATPLPFGENR